MKKPKLLFVSSSGGHLEQLLMLKPLMEKYDSKIVTEKTKFNKVGDYFVFQTGHKDKFMIFKVFINLIYAFIIFIKERPTHIISTGAITVVPFAFIAKLFNVKIIFIETFARTNDKTKTGEFMYKIADLFIVQWESLLEIYPDAVYGGSIY